MADTQTITLQKARAASRKNKAKKAVKEIKQQVKKHTDYKDVRVSNGLNETIWSEGAANPPRTVEVQLIDLEDHVLVETADFEEEVEEKVESQETEEVEDIEEEKEVEDVKESQGDIPEEVREVLEDGTISEGKEAVQSMNKADFEELLNFEERNQNRKGMKKFLRSNMR